jgi:hypothetical protein
VAGQRLKVQLIDGLGRDELHRWALHRFGNGLCVTEVILLSLRERSAQASTGHRGQTSGAGG